MCIANRIFEANYKYGIYEKDNALTYELDNALIQVMIAIDGTAAKEYPRLGNKGRFTTFINDNLDIISKITFFSFKITTDFKIDEKTFAELIYDIRCDLLHEGFTKDIVWNERSLKYENGKYYIPTGILTGLLFAVIGSEKNKDENVRVGSIIPAHDFFYKHKHVHIAYDRVIGNKSNIFTFLSELEQ